MNTDVVSVHAEDDVQSLLELMRKHELPGVPVIDHSRDSITLRPDDTVRHAATLIAERKHNRLPVVDPDRTLVGVVTRVDVLEALAAQS